MFHRVVLKRNQSGKEGVAERDILLQSFFRLFMEPRPLMDSCTLLKFNFSVRTKLSILCLL